MAAIVDDVLTLAGEDDSVELTAPLSLRAVARSAWTNVDSQTAMIGVTDDLHIQTDRARLQRLLENLFRNAVDHVGPNVTVTLGPVETDGSEDETGFFVEEDGPGIPTAESEQVFESGYTDASDGTGLGLAIVRRIADAHGWTVTATEGRQGRTRFEFTGIEPG